MQDIKIQFPEKVDLSLIDNPEKLRAYQRYLYESALQLQALVHETTMLHAKLRFMNAVMMLVTLMNVASILFR